jgi:predicted O-methyltransferase YrrM
MSKGVCPWWMGYLLASPVRTWLRGQKPAAILDSYVREGMIVFEPGPGMGFFTLELARRVGPSGRIVAVDIQPKMLAGLKRRAAKAGVLERIDARLVAADSMNLSDLTGKVDFTLAFALVHEMPSSEAFFSELATLSKPGALVLFAEPRGHVKEQDFETELQHAQDAGFMVARHLKVPHSRAVLLKKM